MAIEFETVLDLIDLVDPITGKIESDKLPELIIAGLRQGTKAELDAADPPLEPNEPAFETDTEVLRVGDVEVGATFASQAETDASTVSGKAVSPSTLRLRKDSNGAFSIGDLGGDARGEDTITIQPNRAVSDQVAVGIGSIAIGKNAKAEATGSAYYGDPEFGCVAVGMGATASASGDYGQSKGSVAIGSDSSATGEQACAMGTAEASNNYAIAIGRNAIASGINSTALGAFSNASETSSTAVGQNAVASGYRATASGYATASNNYATASGYFSTASGASSTAIGRNTTASQTNSGAFGCYVKSTVANVQELGYWSGSTTRAGAVRVHGTGMVAMTYQDRATEYDASLAGNGSEADNELADGMFAIRTNGNDVILDINIGGTVKNINLGTAA